MDIIFEPKRGILYDLTECMGIGYNEDYSNICKKYNVEPLPLIIKAYEKLWEGVNKNEKELELYLLSCISDKGMYYLNKFYDKKTLWDMQKTETYIDWFSKLNYESLIQRMNAALECFTKDERTIDLGTESSKEFLFSCLESIDELSLSVKWEIMNFYDNPQRLHLKFSEFLSSYARCLMNIYNENSIWFKKRCEAINEWITAKGKLPFEKELEKNQFGKPYKRAFISVSLLNEFCIDVSDFDDDLYIVLGARSNDFYEQLKGTESNEHFFNMLKVMSDQTRFSILKATSKKPLYGAEIASKLNLTPATIKHHLEILNVSGLLKVNRENGYKIYYSLDKQELKKLLNYIHNVFGI